MLVLAGLVLLALAPPLATVCRSRTVAWALGLLGTAIAGVGLLPASVSRQQMVLVPDLILGDGLSTWLLLALAVHLLAKGPTGWTPWLALMALGTAATSLSSHLLLTAAALTVVVVLWAVALWREGVPARRCVNLALGAALVFGGLYVHLSNQGGSFPPTGQRPLEPTAWALMFLGVWALLALWPFSILSPGREKPQGSILRLAVAVLLLRTLNLGPWPPTAALAGSIALVLPLLVELFRKNTATLHKVLPSYFLLALAPIGGPLGPAAAMACEFIYPLWALRPTVSDVGGMATAVAWLASSAVPLWLAAATMHQTGLTAYGALLLLAGLVALTRVPEAHRPGLAPLVPVPAFLFPVGWKYLVAPASDSLYQGLGPMFVAADPWAGVYFPSGDLVLAVLPFPTLVLTLPALLALLAVVARYLRALERRS